MSAVLGMVFGAKTAPSRRNLSSFMNKVCPSFTPPPLLTNRTCFCVSPTLLSSRNVSEPSGANRRHVYSHEALFGRNCRVQGQQKSYARIFFTLSPDFPRDQLQIPIQEVAATRSSVIMALLRIILRALVEAARQATFSTHGLQQMQVSGCCVRPDVFKPQLSNCSEPLLFGPTPGGHSIFP